MFCYYISLLSAIVQPHHRAGRPFTKLRNSLFQAGCELEQGCDKQFNPAEQVTLVYSALTRTKAVIFGCVIQLIIYFKNGNYKNGKNLKNSCNCVQLPMAKIAFFSFSRLKNVDDSSIYRRFYV